MSHTRSGNEEFKANVYPKRLFGIEQSGYQGIPRMLADS
jgi:hypothetical protein